MQKKINLKIEHRESFRPFAPSVMVEDYHRLFELNGLSPFMLLVAPVRNEIRLKLPRKYHQLGLSQRINVARSQLPAITHVDFSARIHTVSKENNPRFWKLINAFKAQSGVGCVVNTSFNVRSEPIVCTPQDAYRCFMRTEMDHLVVGDCLYDKNKQPPWREA